MRLTPGARLSRAPHQADREAGSREVIQGQGRFGRAPWLRRRPAITLLRTMQALRAHVKKGQLVLDDPSTRVDERERLIQAIEDGAEDIERGDCVDGFAFAQELLARREAAPR